MEAKTIHLLMFFYFIIAMVIIIYFIINIVHIIITSILKILNKFLYWLSVAGTILDNISVTYFYLKPNIFIFIFFDIRKIRFI